MEFKTNFPQPKYLGNKFKHLEWIRKCIPDDVKRIADLFSGSGCVSYMLREQGYDVLINDFMTFNSYIAKGLIENTHITIDKEFSDKLFKVRETSYQNSVFQRLYSGLFFTEEECIIIDSFRKNLNDLCDFSEKDNIHRFYLSISIMMRAMQRKVMMGYFAHTKALHYANDEKKIKRDIQLTYSLKDLFDKIAVEMNAAIFSGKGKVISILNHDALELSGLLPKDDVDLIYLDPPYCGSHANYQSYYHLLETFCCQYNENTHSFVNSIKRYHPQKEEKFSTKSEFDKNFPVLITRCKNIANYILLSYNTSSYPSLEKLIEIIDEVGFSKKYVFEKEYENCNGGRGTKKGISELLILLKR